MASEQTRLAVAVAAGVGLGAAVVCLYNKRYPSKQQEQEIKQCDGYVWNRPSIAPKQVMDNLSAKEAEAETAAVAPAIDVRQTTLSDSSSHMAANHLSAWQEDPNTIPQWPPAQTKKKVENPMNIKLPGMNFLNTNEKVVGHIIENDSKANTRATALADGCIRANATKFIWWEPTKVKAAMVTCGGLCPGLNSIIKGLTNCLWHDYGVREIWGITAGYKGISEPDKNDWISLNPKLVSERRGKPCPLLPPHLCPTAMLAMKEGRRRDLRKRRPTTSRRCARSTSRVAPS